MCKLTIICSDSISFPLVKQTRTSVFFFFFLFKVNFMLLKIIPMCIVRNLTESIKLILIYSCFPTHCNIPISLTIVLLSDQYMYIMQKRQTVKLNLCEKEQLLLNCHSCFPEANSANSQLLLLSNSKTCCCSYLFFLFFLAESWHMGSQFLNQGSNPCPCSGMTESKPLDCQGIPLSFLLLFSFRHYLSISH